VDGYWTPLRAMVDQLIAQRYMRPEQQDLFRMVKSVHDVPPTLRAMPSAAQPVESLRI
jgi:predicted Rossmann-fold nucleotide-binding protein